MKVIKKGESWSKKYRCTGRGYGGGGCGAILLLTRHDLYETCPEAHEEWINFCCPECGVETKVSGATPFGKRPSEEEIERRRKRKNS